jgi:hypothetical protein
MSSSTVIARKSPWVAGLKWAFAMLATAAWIRVAVFASSWVSTLPETWQPGWREIPLIPRWVLLGAFGIIVYCALRKRSPRMRIFLPALALAPLYAFFIFAAAQ